ncbi:hypothetical protein PAXRUDRAFT_828452 [Paxillus rubicundulus Ve08.2h10]|uniref:Uncharacterized protein n=1 Tax=Paxillus rubicundulus Ve08.2h10 TaxID=930991 RepID=A0A0D0DW41_9AGAM|nr:hypothetical protein PAXRUDRAFT_828452 [Paxillus rubicundulus Ve08.2h10]
MYRVGQPDSPFHRSQTQQQIFVYLLALIYLLILIDQRAIENRGSSQQKTGLRELELGPDHVRKISKHK